MASAYSTLSIRTCLFQPAAVSDITISYAHSREREREVHGPAEQQLLSQLRAGLISLATPQIDRCQFWKFRHEYFGNER